ncbi:hypothetical protein Ahy_B05g076509 [Arachis hypogaea]|uniref:PIPK domain-containing protein n=1 Tax=Arachis hypogaea TaxID=3818 RepID=A0A444Z3S5_ARAHY|nr:hypothetical protein Ahy_B05g076509 [Arachis hypogaea]
MYIKFYLLEETYKLFDEMPERNVVSWTTLIFAYSQAKFGMQAHVHVLKYDQDLILNNALLDMFMEDAKLIFNSMADKDVISCCCLLKRLTCCICLRPLIRLGVNMPGRAECMARRSDFDQYTTVGINHLTPYHNGETSDVVLYFGIIDILQDYDISKKLEHAMNRAMNKKKK